MAYKLSGKKSFRAALFTCRKRENDLSVAFSACTNTLLSSALLCTFNLLFMSFHLILEFSRRVLQLLCPARTWLTSFWFQTSCMLSNYLPADRDSWTGIVCPVRMLLPLGDGSRASRVLVICVSAGEWQKLFSKQWQLCCMQADQPLGLISIPLGKFPLAPRWWQPRQDLGREMLCPSLSQGYGRWAPSLGEVCGGPGAVSNELQEKVCTLLPFKEGIWNISWNFTEVRARTWGGGMSGVLLGEAVDKDNLKGSCWSSWFLTAAELFLVPAQT